MDDDIPSLVDASLQDNEHEVDANRNDDQPAFKVPITIVSEFGDSADIEKALTINEKGEEVQEWLELGNGCICCSVKDQGVNAIESLMERSGAFDYILLETSGVADPGNIAPLFWVDEGLGSTIYLDGIVVLVDAKNIVRTLDERKPHAEQAEEESEGRDEYRHLSTAHLQLSHADVIVLNKTDIVSADELLEARSRIAGINGLARIIETQFGQVPKLEGSLLDLHAYDSVDAIPATEVHGHPDPSISTVTFNLPKLKPTDLQAVDEWLRSVLWESTLPGDSNASLPTSEPWSVHRLKGRVLLDDDNFHMIQGVREVFEISDAKTGSTSDSIKDGKIVVIGRNVAKVAWEQSLRQFLENRQ